MMVNPKTQQRYVLLSEEDISYHAGPWPDEERDLLRTEALEALGWDGMEAYQDDERS